MKLFVEGYHYDESLKYAEVLQRFNPQYFTEKNGTETICSYCVGYSYVKGDVDDCIFILPKTVCDVNDHIFGLSPEDVIDVQLAKLDSVKKDFLGNLSVWIYRALNEYQKGRPSTGVLLFQSFSKVATGRSANGTYIDIFLSLKKFYDENRDFFIYTMRNIHSQQHRINWPKTISHTTAIIQDGVPIYLDPVSRKKSINWDEELMTIFFSILNFMNKYGFNISVNLNYDIIRGERFKSYLSGLGLNKLRQIRHSYFSDKTKKIWELCYAFFEKAEEVASSMQDSDYLMATNFNTVFEAMVDRLIGDPSLADKKKLNDNKIIDHIFTYQSLFSSDDVYYIGDSKYYKKGQGPSSSSKDTYKQFTYARNIVNDWIRDNFVKLQKSSWPYRDQLTEGYNSIPNFFISSVIEENLRFDKDEIGRDDLCGRPIPFIQFPNRLFDRDTLWVRQYNINFLYLLSVYASANNAEAERFRKKAYRFFRKHTIEMLNNEYEFWVLTPKSGQQLQNVMTAEIKWELRGMCYSLDADKLLLAIEKYKPLDGLSKEDDSYNYFLDYNSNIDADVKRIQKTIYSNFDTRRCVLSEDPKQIVQDRTDTDFIFDLSLK